MLNMEKKYVGELTSEELEKVFHANEKLRYAISDDMVDSELCWVGEQIDYLRNRLADWRIEPGSRTYIRVNDYGQFVDNMVELDNSVPVLIDEDLPLLEKAKELKEKLWSVEMYTDEYDELQEQFEEAVDELVGVLEKRFTDRFDGCYNKEYMLDYFKEFYKEARLDENCYIIEGDETYTLYEDVSYTKSFR